MKRTPLNRGTKGLGRGNKPLQSKSSLSTKSTLKKTSTRLKMTSKTAKRKKKYREEILMKNEEGNGLCNGCGLVKPLTNSHLCPQRNYPELVAVRENVEPACHECHSMWEHQVERMSLKNYSDLRQRVKNLSEEYFKLLEYNESKHSWTEE